MLRVDLNEPLMDLSCSRTRSYVSSSAPVIPAYQSVLFSFSYLTARNRADVINGTDEPSGALQCDFPYETRLFHNPYPNNFDTCSPRTILIGFLMTAFSVVGSSQRSPIYSLLRVGPTSPITRPAVLSRNVHRFACPVCVPPLCPPLRSVRTAQLLPRFSATSSSTLLSLKARPSLRL